MQNATKNCGKIVGVLQKKIVTYITVILAVLEHARAPKIAILKRKKKRWQLKKRQCV